MVGVVAGVEVMTTAAGVEYEARSKRNLQLRNLARAINVGAANSTYMGNSTKYLFGLRAQFVAVRAEYFDDDLTIDLRNAFEHVIAYRL